MATGPLAAICAVWLMGTRGGRAINAVAGQNYGINPIGQASTQARDSATRPANWESTFPSCVESKKLCPALEPLPPQGHHQQANPPASPTPSRPSQSDDG